MAKAIQGIEARMDNLFQELEQVAGGDPHEPGVMEKVAGVLQKAVADPELRDALAEKSRATSDIYGTMEKPGFGMAGVPSAKIGYRGPHDHGDCWAINVQLAGELRLVHWERAAGEQFSPRITLRRGSEVLMKPGDVDCSPPGIAHELFPETDDSIEMAVRCHSLASVVQNRYDRKTGKFIHWSWGKKQAVGEGEFDVLGGDDVGEIPEDIANRL